MYTKSLNIYNIKKKDKINRKRFSLEEDSLFVSSTLYDIKALKISSRIINKKHLSRTTIRNYCLLTGRAKFILSKFRLSRLTFRTLALFGYIPGIRKGLW